MRRSLFGFLALLATAGLLAAQRDRTEEPPPYPFLLVPEDALLGHLTQGPFREPRGLYFDHEARELFVVDTKHHLIGIYDIHGTPLFAFGGANLLQDPTQVSVDAEGSILVLDADQDRLKAFNYRGEPREPLRFDDGDGPVRIRAFARSRDGGFVIATDEPARLLLFDAQRQLVRRIESERRGPSFEIPTSVAVSSKGWIVVTDFRAKPVQVFDETGRFVRGFGVRDISRQGFAAPVHCAFDEEDFLYVTDMLRHDVKIFDLRGEFRGIFGGWFAPETGGRGGRAPGEMLYPTNAVVEPGGNVYVSERFGRRVQVFRRVPIDSDEGRRLLRRRAP